MARALVAIAVLAVIAGALWTFRVQRLRQLARDRLNESMEGLEAAVSAVEITPTLRRHYIIPWIFAAMFGAILYLGFQLGPVYCVAITVIAGVIGYLIEGWIAARNALRLEAQLANAIDLMVASLSAGSGVGEAIDSAARESPKPLKSELEEVLGRIRFGESPKQVFEDFGLRIPLETYRLFSFTMAVHGEVGGSLAPTLSTVGKSIRDRIEIGRRVRAQATQAQASVIGIVCITYFLGLLMWRTNPPRFEEFLKHPVGADFVAGAMVLQAIGLLWITRLSQFKF